MNERIKQLAAKAGFEITPWSNESVPCVHQEGPIDVELEKFAELIVGYCISKINNLHSITADEMISKGYRNRASYSGALNDAASLLRKDFEGEE